MIPRLSMKMNKCSISWFESALATIHGALSLVGSGVWTVTDLSLLIQDNVIYFHVTAEVQGVPGLEIFSSSSLYSYH